jgi:hypothetical protein
MTDSEDPAVEAMQVAGSDGAINSAPRITQQTRQLANRDDSMLPLCQIGE